MTLGNDSGQLKSTGFTLREKIKLFQSLRLNNAWPCEEATAQEPVTPTAIKHIAVSSTCVCKTPTLERDASRQKAKRTEAAR